MKERQFNSQNAFKLIRRVIYSIAIIFFLYSLLLFYGSREYISGVEWIKTYNELCLPMNDAGLRIDCLIIVRDGFEYRFNLAWQLLLVAIALPTTIIVSTKLFNYLFPKNKDSKLL